MKTKKYTVLLSVIMAACVFITALSGCAPKEDNSNKLIIWTNMQVEVDILSQLGTKWGELTGHEVEVHHQSTAVQKFVQATNSPDGPDAFVGIPNDQLADFVNAGLVATVPEDLFNDEDFSPAAIQACYVDGARYGAPLAVETIALFYNTDKIETPPQTWEQLIEMAASSGGLQFEATSVYYDLGFLRAFGGYIFNYEGGAYDVSDIGLGGEGAVAAYEYLDSLCKEHGFVSASVSSDIARSNFQNGQTAFYIGGPWDVDGFNSAGTPFKLAPMPTINGAPFVTPVGTQLSFVSNKSAKQDMAWEFIMYLIDECAIELYEGGDRIPAKLVFQENEIISSDPIPGAFIEQIKNGEPMPTVSELAQVWGPFTNNIKAMFNGDIDAETAAENIQKQVEEGIALMASGK